MYKPNKGWQRKSERVSKKLFRSKKEKKSRKTCWQNKKRKKQSDVFNFFRCTPFELKGCFILSGNHITSKTAILALINFSLGFSTENNQYLIYILEVMTKFFLIKKRSISDIYHKKFALKNWFSLWIKIILIPEEGASNTKLLSSVNVFIFFTGKTFF